MSGHRVKGVNYATKRETANVGMEARTPNRKYGLGPLVILSQHTCLAVGERGENVSGIEGGGTERGERGTGGHRGA